MTLHAVYRAILRGVQDRGEGGFLYLRGSDGAYMFPHELLGRDDFRGSMRELLEADAARHVFYVAEERDGSIHLLAYPRHVVRDEVTRAAAAVDGGGAGGGGEDPVSADGAA